MVFKLGVTTLLRVDKFQQRGHQTLRLRIFFCIYLYNKSKINFFLVVFLHPEDLVGREITSKRSLKTPVVKEENGGGT